MRENAENIPVEFLSMVKLRTVLVSNSSAQTFCSKFPNVSLLKKFAGHRNPTWSGLEADSFDLGYSLFFVFVFQKKIRLLFTAQF